MKKIEIVAQKRRALGSSDAHRLRREGRVPCVLYGGGENLHMSIPEKEMKPLVYTTDVFEVTLDIDGESRRSILQDVQFHPVTDQMVHADFFSLQEDRPVTVNVPVRTEGKASGVLLGGLLRIRHKKVPIRALPVNIPDEIRIDISDLEIGDTFKVEDVELDDAEILLVKEDVIAAVRMARAVIEEVEEEEEEGVEGEEAVAEEGEAKPAEASAEAKPEAKGEEAS